MCHYGYMKHYPHLSEINPGYYTYTVFNPLYGNTCSIRDVIINGLIKEKATLEVRLQVDHKEKLWVREVVNPKKWKKEAKETTMYGKYREPMLMYQREVQADGEPALWEDMFSRKAEPQLREEELYI